MMGNDGHLTMLSKEEVERMLRPPEAFKPPPGQVLMFGTEPEMRAISQRVRLGDKELVNRAARRRAQKQARRKNR